MKFEIGDSVTFKHNPLSLPLSQGGLYEVQGIKICPCDKCKGREKIAIKNDEGNFIWLDVEFFDKLNPTQLTLKEQLTHAMEEQLAHAIENQDFEKAAQLRDQLNAQ